MSKAMKIVIISFVIYSMMQIIGCSLSHIYVSFWSRQLINKSSNRFKQEDYTTNTPSECIQKQPLPGSSILGILHYGFTHRCHVFSMYNTDHILVEPEQVVIYIKTSENQNTNDSVISHFAAEKSKFDVSTRPILVKLVRQLTENKPRKEPSLRAQLLPTTVSTSVMREKTPVMGLNSGKRLSSSNGHLPKDTTQEQDPQYAPPTMTLAASFIAENKHVTDINVSNSFQIPGHQNTPSSERNQEQKDSACTCGSVFGTVGSKQASNIFSYGALKYLYIFDSKKDDFINMTFKLPFRGRNFVFDSIHCRIFYLYSRDIKLLCMNGKDKTTIKRERASLRYILFDRNREYLLYFFKSGSRQFTWKCISRKGDVETTMLKMNYNIVNPSLDYVSLYIFWRSAVDASIHQSKYDVYQHRLQKSKDITHFVGYGYDLTVAPLLNSVLLCTEDGALEMFNVKTHKKERVDLKYKCHKVMYSNERWIDYVGHSIFIYTLDRKLVMEVTKYKNHNLAFG